MIPANELTATEVVAEIRSGSLAVTDIAQAIIARFDARDADVRAFAYFDRDYILDQARILDAMRFKGPLHGVPIGIKDVINTKDMPTEHNNERYAGSRPGVDAACVDTLRAAGALLIGKTMTTEFAESDVGGATRNPLDLSRTPGGSSSGSAAAVADFQSAIALGTQTGGSTIRPASFTGIYGWKPTWNSISREGLKMLSISCDTLGLYSRSAEDLALLADIFDISPLEEPAPESIADLRIAVVGFPVWPKALPSTEKAMTEGCEQLRAAGATVIDLELPQLFDSLHDAHSTIVAAESHSAFLNEYRNNPALSEKLRSRVEDRDRRTAASYRAAYVLADKCRAIFDDIASEHDCVLAPSATGEAPLGIEWTGDAVFNSMWTLLQVPVVNVPGFYGSANMPVGLSLIGRRYQDRKVIAAAELAGGLFSTPGHRIGAV